MTETPPNRCPYVVLWSYSDRSGFGVAAIFEDADDANVYAKHMGAHSDREFIVVGPSQFELIAGGRGFVSEGTHSHGQ